MSDDARHVDMEEAMTDYTALFKEAARKVHPSWAITNYQAMETRNGMAFSCQLTANGNVVADVEQGGNGGATLLYWMKEARTDGTEQRFLAEADALFPGRFEVDGDLIEALLTKAGL
jgi:hypothetical protein